MFCQMRVGSVVSVLATAFMPLALQSVGSAEPEDATAEQRANESSAADPAQAGIRFERDIAPILQANCVDCHGGELQMADLRLDSREAVFEAGVIEPGKSGESLLIARLLDKELGILMPPTGQLPAEAVKTLQAWIDGGAEWPEGVTLAAQPQASASDLTLQAVKSALRSGRTDSLARLLESQTEEHSIVALTDTRGATPLLYAAMYGNAAAARMLLDAGADANAAATDGATALMWGARNAELVRLLIDRGANVNARSKAGRTPLIIAASYAGNLDAVRSLLAAGADVNSQDSEHVTPLSAAAEARETELLELLLDAGADVHARSTRQRTGTPLARAAYANDLAAVRLLLDRGAAEEGPSLNLALILACLHGSRELAHELLDAGADPNGSVSTSVYPETPLTAAAYTDYQNVELVKLLLDHGASVRQKNSRGETPLDLAARHGNTEIVSLLTEHRVRQAAQESVSLLQSCGPTFFAKSGCAACHQQSATSLVLQLARPRGLVIDEQTAREQIKLTSVDLGTKQSHFLQRRYIGGTAHRIAYLMWGLAAEDYAADDVTDAAVFELVGQQRKDGSWLSDGHRPPSEYSQMSATAISARVIQLFAPPALADETAQVLKRAREWLAAAQPATNEEHAFRLLGLKWLGADQAVLKAATEPLLAQQREDGGWAQLAHLESDAYATGLTLYSLHDGGGVDADHESYQRGIAFLLETQNEDGSWHVQSRSHKFQPYFESGFPYGDDQWISAAGTGWATMALLLTIDERQ